MLCRFISFLGLGCPGTNASDSGDCRRISVKKGMLMSLSSRQLGHVEQYNLFELQCDGHYDMDPDFLSYSRYQEAYWSRCGSSWYPLDF